MGTVTRMLHCGCEAGDFLVCCCVVARGLGVVAKV